MAIARAKTEVEVANGALEHCSEPPLATFNDDSIRARACRRNFGTARDYVLDRHDANFASTWITPAASVTPPAGPWKFQYPLPGDCLRVREVENLASDEWQVATTVHKDAANATVSGKVLLCDVAAPRVRYTRAEGNLALWDASAIVALEYALAWKINPKVGRDPSITNNLKLAADDALDIQRKADGRESAASQFSRNTSWIAARRGRVRP